MKNKGVKKVGCELKQNIWEAITLAKMNTNISIKEMINEIIVNYLIAYAKEKNVSKEMLKMIEEKLKAVEEEK